MTNTRLVERGQSFH